MHHQIKLSKSIRSRGTDTANLMLDFVFDLMNFHFDRDANLSVLFCGSTKSATQNAAHPLPAGLVPRFEVIRMVEAAQPPPGAKLHLIDLNLTPKLTPTPIRTRAS